MSKRNIRKAAYKAIVKEGKSHQEAYDEVSKVYYSDLETVASEVSKVPSTGKTAENLSLRTIYMIALGLIIVLRALGAYELIVIRALDPFFIILFLVIGVIIPGYGIYGALMRKAELYYSVSMVLTFSIFRSFTQNDVNFDLDTVALITFIPFVVAIGLGFYMPSRLKTEYKSGVKTIEKDGQSKNVTTYTFEDTRLTNDELLDTL